jgi:hypothetical protein
MQEEKSRSAKRYSKVLKSNMDPLCLISLSNESLFLPLVLCGAGPLK